MTDPASRWPQSSTQERAAFQIVEKHLGVTATEWDTAGKSGAVDARLTYSSGDQASFEVMSHMAEGALKLEALALKHAVMPAPGDWTWLLQPPDLAVFEWLRTQYHHLIMLCEQHKVNQPRDLPEAVRMADSVVQQFNLSGANLVGSQLMAQSEDPVVNVVLPGLGGAVDYALSNLQAELAKANALPVFERHFAKLQNDGLSERHLFIPVHYTAFSFAVSHALLSGGVLPPDPPPTEPRVTHLWLASGFGRVLHWADGQWEQFWI